MKCEGYRGSKPDGLPVWVTCENPAVGLLITDAAREIPACEDCRNAVETSGSKVFAVKPL